MYRLESMCTYGVIRLVYKRIRIFSDEELKFIFDLYNFQEPRFCVRYVNLANVHRRDVPPYFKNNSACWSNIVEKLEQNAGNDLSARSIYFLKYIPKSFTSLHVDNPSTTLRTAVTLLEASEDLQGGEILIQRKAAEQDFYNADDPIGGNSKKIFTPTSIQDMIIPEIVRQKVGETIFYDQSLLHGVTRVERGHRLVLITWFKQNENNQIQKEAV